MLFFRIFARAETIFSLANVKAILRKMYGRWACDLTVPEIEGGSQQEDAKIRNNVKTCRLNLFAWLTKAADQMREQEGVRGTVHCWESTQLHRAWEKGVYAARGSKNGRCVVWKRLTHCLCCKAGRLVVD